MFLADRKKERDERWTPARSSYMKAGFTAPQFQHMETSPNV